MPDAFPSILQDAIVIGLLVLDRHVRLRGQAADDVGGRRRRRRLRAAGHARQRVRRPGIQSEKPFRVGHWIRVGEFEGRVAEVTWRATKLRTKSGNFVIVPNNIVAKEAITNYSEPAVPTRLEVEVGASYLSTPADVKAAALEALRQVPRVLHVAGAGRPAARVRRLRDHLPRALLDRRTTSSTTRRATRCGPAIFYAFGRHGIEIPWPIEVGYSRDWPEPDAATKQQRARAVLARVDLFARLTDGAAPRDRGRVVDPAVRQRRDDRPAGRAGPVDVRRLLGRGRRSCSSRSGGGRGDRAGRLLRRDVAADRRRRASASVVARGDTTVLELDADVFRALGAADPQAVEQIGLAAMKRRAELDQVRERDQERRRGRCPGDVPGQDEEVSGAD